MTPIAISSLLAAIVSFAIGVSVVLRDRTRPVFFRFTVLCFAMGFWHLALVLRATFAGYAHGTSDFFGWCAMVWAAGLPLATLGFFEAFLADDPARPPPGSRWLLAGTVTAWAVLAYSLLFLRVHDRPAFDVLSAGFVVLGFGLSLNLVYRRYRAASGSEGTRLLYLLVGAAVAVLLGMARFVPSLSGLSVLGNVMAIIYLYFVSQTLFRFRLLDLNELLGRIVVVSILVLIMAGLYGLLLSWVEPATLAFFFNTIVASFVILVLFDPLRAAVEDLVNRWMFHEKYELRRRIEQLRRELVNVIDVEEAARATLRALEESQRVTHASVYLQNREGTGYDLAACVGPAPAPSLDVITRRPFFERLRREGALLVENVERELSDPLADEARAAETSEVRRTLEDMKSSVCLPLLADRALLGLLSLRDERLREALSGEEVQLVRGLAAQLSITLQNSRAYERMKERERLAALGVMAAGLAHEIRNPLGAIKGAAQLIQSSGGADGAGDGASGAPAGAPAGTGAPPGADAGGEFLAVIVEEVNRLNQVVSQFLDYARPDHGEREPADVNEIVRRTVQLLEQEQSRVEIRTALDAGLPVIPCRADQLRQVFLNLGLNALQAMSGGGELTVSTGLRRGARRGEPASFVEVRFADTGPGIAPESMKNLFVPFYTTKDRGTGLGLAICQRIAENHGGAIEVRSRPGKGATFTVLLPVGDEAATRTGPPGAGRRASAAG